HATYHAQYDAPLASDVHGFARPVSGWVHSSASALTVAADGARAVQAALQYPGQIATLILPADTAWLEAGRPAPALPKPTPVIASDEAIGQAASALRSDRKTMILMRGAALKERGLHAAGRIAATTGARIACDTFAPRCQRGAGRVAVERIPYFAEQIVEFMKGTEQLILVGASPPVSFFAYPNKPSWCTPEDCRILYLAHPNEDGTVALEALSDAVKAPKQPLHDGVSRKPDIPNGPLNPLTAGQVIAHIAAAPVYAAVVMNGTNPPPQPFPMANCAARPFGERALPFAERALLTALIPHRKLFSTRRARARVVRENFVREGADGCITIVDVGVRLRLRRRCCLRPG